MLMNFYSHSFSWPDKGEKTKIFGEQKIVLFQKNCLSLFSKYLIYLRKIVSWLMIPHLANGQRSDYPRKLLFANSLQLVDNGKNCRRITYSTTEGIFQNVVRFSFKQLQTMLVVSKLWRKTGEMLAERESISGASNLHKFGDAYQPFSSYIFKCIKQNTQNYKKPITVY